MSITLIIHFIYKRYSLNLIMEFAGNNYTYLSKKKLDKINNLQTPGLWANPEKESSQLMKENNDKLNDLMDVDIVEKEKKKDDDDLSNSYESFEDGELNKSYSEEEGNKNSQMFHTNQPNLNKAKTKKHKKVVDTNILYIKLEKLQDKSTFVTGEPKNCSKCKAYLSHISKIIPNKDNTSLWACEFCDQENILQIEQEEISKDVLVDYFIEKVATNKSTTTQSGGNLLYYIVLISVAVWVIQ